MKVSLSKDFLTALERIDNVVMIDSCKIDKIYSYKPEVVCHDGKIQVCLVGVSRGECSQLDFYYGSELLAFSITNEDNQIIKLNPERTIFEFTFPELPKAIIGCSWLSEDTKYIEGIGLELGNSLYKDIKVSDDSLVWKETLGKYIVDHGITENHDYNVERLDTKSGKIEERPIRFKSYQGITIKQGEWRIKSTKQTTSIKHDVYSEISDSTFFVWDSPMIDATVNLEADPTCINNLGTYLDPGNVVFGNTDCFQYTNYQSTLRGFRVEGTEGSEIEFLFNKSYTQGSYTSFKCKIGESGETEVRLTELPYYHFNGILTTGPSRITKVENIMYLEENVDTYIPDPDKTYVADIKNVKCTIKIEGTCDYIEYEKYLGEVKKIGKGTEHINSIPEVIIEEIDNGGLVVEEIDNLGKQITCDQNSNIDREIRYSVFQVKIDNNIEVDGNILTPSILVSDYKIRIEQTGIVWKIVNSPDYLKEDGYGIYLWNHEQGSTRTIKIITNNSNVSPGYTSIESVYGEELKRVFNIPSEIICGDDELIDGDWWYTFYVGISTKETNDTEDWIPKGDGETPYIIQFKLGDVIINSISFYAIQLREIEPKIEVWEETLPGKFSQVDTGVIEIHNSLVKNFIVIKKGNPETDAMWYYYDLNGTNKFYITDLGSQTTNSGFIYYPESTENPTLIDLGIEDRSIFGRTINVNRSDLIGSVGVLTITETPGYPGSWTDLINNNTINLEVTRDKDDIYISVGPYSEGGVEVLKNQDYVLEVSRIGVYQIKVLSNFKYVIETFGYLEFYGSEHETRKEVFRGYNIEATYNLSLTRLDEEQGMAESYVEIRSGSLIRKVTLKIVGPDVENDYLIEGVTKPNLIRVFKNEALTNVPQNFLYTSTTTPNISYHGVTKAGTDTTNSVFSDYTYQYHDSSITVTVPNSKTLSYSKYPIKSFGSIQESSLSYSDKEDAPLEYLFYMKGKKHHIWSVKNINGFSGLTDEKNGDTDLYIDASGETGIMVYVVSRYDVENKTFITEIPKTNEVKISRNDLEAVFKISQQQKITLDEITQIEYAIPIQVNCNITNNGGNIFLGNLEYKAYTEVSESSVTEVIEVPSEIIELEGINKQYIEDNILFDDIYILDEQGNIIKREPQTLSINIFQQGTNPDIFEIYSDVTDMGIMAETQYIIPEIGSDITLIPTPKWYSVGVYGDGDNICTIDFKCTDKYFLVTINSEDRISEHDPESTFWFDEIPEGIVNDTKYLIGFNLPYKLNGENKTFIHNSAFIKYGCRYGLYVEGKYGFGYIEKYSIDKSLSVYIPEDGGRVCIHAGIFYAVDGVWETEALICPTEFKFIGNNIPDDILWEDGNADDEGNLVITVPPRTRDDYGTKDFIMQVTQPHKYYPLNLYITFSQASYYVESDPDTDQKKYKLMFLTDEINIHSDGTIDGGEDKIYFSHNLNKEIFDNVFFDWEMRDGGEIPIYPDDLSLEEIERNYEEGYVKFKFKPNGSRTFIKAFINAKYKDDKDNIHVIGRMEANQGYYCLIATYHNPMMRERNNASLFSNYLSRISSKQLTLFKVSGTYPLYFGYLPCKSNNNNSRAQYNDCNSRGVFELECYRHEFYDKEEEEIEVKDVFKEVTLVNMSPSAQLKDYSVSFIPYSEQDTDAKTDPTACNDGYSNLDYITSTNFQNFTPYIEINYELKEDYIKQKICFGVSCNVSIINPITETVANYYFSTVFVSSESDEPPTFDSIILSPDKLKFDYRGGKKTIAFSPTSCRNMLSLTLMPDSDNWVSYTNPAVNSNVFQFTATSNKSSETKKTYYRTTQARIDVKDPRNQYPLGAFFVDIEQEPDIAQTSGGGGGGGGTQPVVGNGIVNITNDAPTVMTIDNRVKVLLWNSEDDTFPVLTGSLIDDGTVSDTYKLLIGETKTFSVDWESDLSSEVLEGMAFAQKGEVPGATTGNSYERAGYHSNTAYLFDGDAFTMSVDLTGTFTFNATYPLTIGIASVAWKT
jgi:hypothetical protein